MEHEAFVPFPPDTVRRALTEPHRLARCLPGFQRDEDGSSGPLTGRLRVRISGSSITYRGSLHVTERADGFDVVGEGTEARGNGSAKLTMTVLPEAVATGTTLRCSGSVRGEGRLSEFEPEVTDATARRLLDRFAADLASGLSAESIAGAVTATGALDPTGPENPAGAGGPTEPGTGAGATEPDSVAGSDEAANEGGPLAVGDRTDDRPGQAGAEGADADPAKSDEGSGPRAEPDAAPADASDQVAADAGEVAESPAEGEAGSGHSVFDTHIPPSSLDPRGDDDGTSEPAGENARAEESTGAGAFGDQVSAEDLTMEDLAAADAPAAEAAHARRTMIGRSAEEVDHAPPRGRYAPVPSPSAGSAVDTLRWAAPAAVVAVASALAVARALRRRR